jgi:hypothetical protein
MENLVLDATVPVETPVLQPVEVNPFDHHELARYAVEAYRNGKVVTKELSDPAWQRFFAYTDRESYLVWVAAWKANYRELSLRQRAIKAELRAAGSDLPWGPSREVIENRHYAQLLLGLRAAAKIDSWAKRQAARSEA